MSEFKKHTNRDYSRFDAMSTDALNEFLRQDSQLPDDEESDLDAVLYIMGVIARREKERPELRFADVDDAWKSFKDNYKPFSNDDRPLYDFEEDHDTPRLADNEPIPITKNKCSSRRNGRGVLRVACVAAAMIIVVFAGSLTAYALGFDLWSAVATWTKDTFGFETVSTAQPEVASSKRQIPEQLKELELMFSEHGLSNSMLPSYIPNGYIQADIKCAETSSSTNFYCLLENRNDSLTFFYRLCPNEVSSFQYEKSENDPEKYEAYGMTYYILKNIDTYSAAWVDGNLECNISGATTYDEIISIINSINGG